MNSADYPLYDAYHPDQTLMDEQAERMESAPTWQKVVIYSASGAAAAYVFAPVAVVLTSEALTYTAPLAGQARDKAEAMAARSPEVIHEALQELEADPNKINHILSEKHAWDSVVDNPNWSKVAPIIEKVMLQGSAKGQTALR